MNLLKILMENSQIWKGEPNMEGGGRSYISLSSEEFFWNQIK